MNTETLTVAWFSFFPIEWLAGLPPQLQGLPKMHPAPWQRVLLAEFEQVPWLRLHVLVLRKQFPRSLTFERNGVAFHCLKTRGGWRAGTLFWHDTLLIRRELAAIQPDVVHAWGSEYGAAIVASRLPYPSVVTIQGLISRMIKLVRPTLYERLLARLEQVGLRRASLATGESQDSSGFLRRHYPHLDVRHIEHAPDPLFCQIPRQPQLEPRRFIYVGRLGHRKGGDLALQALRRLPPEMPWELLVVGDAEPKLVQEVQALTDDGFWRRIRFRNHLTSDQIAEELSRAAMMLCPTRADTGPSTAKEAVVAGVPLVGSAVGGIPDYVVPGRNGFLFPPGDLDACLSAIRATVQHPMLGRGLVDPDTLAEKRAHLSSRRMAEGFLQAYADAKAGKTAAKR